jgi:hypothetical protein
MKYLLVRWTGTISLMVIHPMSLMYIRKKHSKFVFVLKAILSDTVFDNITIKHVYTGEF